MGNRRRSVRNPMRPNIEISHTLNGRVKDLAAEHDITTGEAFRAVIRVGLDELADVETEEMERILETNGE